MCTYFSEIVINILRGMTNMKYEIRENTKKLDRIENMLNDIIKNSNNHLSSSLQTNNDYLIENKYFNQFPLTNIDELTILEDKLKDNDFRLKLVIPNYSISMDYILTYFTIFY